jgi:hypothetical protein
MIPTIAGADPGFQVRGGALKKIAPSGGRCEHFWGISCEKARFYPKKIIFFSILGILMGTNYALLSADCYFISMK